MPVKKGGKKKAAAETQEFKQMPSIVINNIRLTAQTDETTPAPAEEPQNTGARINLRDKFLKEQTAREKKVSIWLWFAMISVITLVVIFWGYSLWYNVSTINWKKTEEGKMIKQTTTDWDQAFKKRQQNNLEKALEAQKIKTALGLAIQQAIGASSTTSTAATSTTSTINIPTSTKR